MTTSYDLPETDRAEPDELTAAGIYFAGTVESTETDLPMAELLPSAVQAIAAAASSVGAIEKDDLHAAGGGGATFKYRGIERILAQVAPALHRHGVVTAPRITSVERTQRPRGNQGNLWEHVQITVGYRFYGPAGDHVYAEVLAEGLDNGDKAASKAMTMAYKTALLQVLNIAGDIDPDAVNEADEGPATRSSDDREPPLRDPWPVRLAREHGAKHAAEVEALMEHLVEGVTNQDGRKLARKVFAETLGNPVNLPPERLPEATEWVDRWRTGDL